MRTFGLLPRDESHPDFHGYDANGDIVIDGHVLIDGMFRSPKAPITLVRQTATVTNMTAWKLEKTTTNGTRPRRIKKV